MKTNHLTIIAMLVFGISTISIAQTKKRESLTVLNIDAQNVPYTPEQLGNIARLEIEKLDTFEVMDRYDVKYLSSKNNLNIENCYGKIGLVEAGTTLQSDKMLSGTIEAYSQTIVLTLRLIDVKKSTIEKIYVNEFLNIPEEIQKIIRVSLCKMFEKPVDEMMFKSLTQKATYDNAINTPNVSRLNLSGPRMGFAVQTGEGGEILRSNDYGGFGGYPVMFQFGYQFEKQYLNEGNYQALFEFIPIFTLVNDQKIIPGITILNGIRSNKNGWEFACGLKFSVSKKATGFYDANNNWIIASDYDANTMDPNPKWTERFDSRGDSYLSGGFVLALGKTFRSGKLNLPVNFYINPGKDGIRFGASFGFNGKKDDAKNKKKMNTL